jgi:hypothetical protein
MLDGVHPKSHDKMVKIYGPKKQMLVLSSMKHPSFSFIIQKLIKRMSTCFYIILYHMSRFPTFLSSSQGIWVGSHKDFSPDSHLYKSPENDLYIIIYIYSFIHIVWGHDTIYIIYTWYNLQSSQGLEWLLPIVTVLGAVSLALAQFAWAKLGPKLLGRKISETSVFSPGRDGKL